MSDTSKWVLVITFGFLFGLAIGNSISINRINKKLKELLK